MKKIIIKSILLPAVLLSTVGLWSCNDFLDEPPSSEISIAQTLKDYKNLLYPTDMSLMSVPPELSVMGDDVYWTPYLYQDAAPNQFSRNAYTWSADVYDLTTVPDSWARLYKLIYIYNKVINEVMDVPGEQPEALAVIQGEARMYRANCYFLLAQMWAKPYQMASESDVAIPMPLENDVNKSAGPQAKVRDLYAFIIDELDKAIKVLPTYPDGRSRLLACGLAAQGYKAKVLFHMGKYDEALTELNKTYKLVQEETHPTLTYGFFNLDGIWTYFPGEPAFGTSPDLPMPFFEPNPESIYTNTNNPFDAGRAFGFTGDNHVFVSHHVRPLLEKPGDMRRVAYYGTLTVMFAPADPENPTELMRMNGYSNMGLTIPELYLMLAECNVRATAGSLTKALECLNTMRKYRISSAVYTELESANKTEVLQWILEERMCEFVASGMRWLDMRRLWDDPVGGPMINKTRTLGNQTYALTKDRLTLRIPPYIMQYNPGWTQNP